MNSKSNIEAKTFEAANTVRSPKLLDLDCRGEDCAQTVETNLASRKPLEHAREIVMPARGYRWEGFD